MIDIRYDRIAHLKRLNLPEVLLSKGIKLKRNGSGSYTGLCPFHKDRNPSLSISLKNDIWLWHCFGCKKGGTLIDFLRYTGESFKEIYQGYAAKSIPLSKEDKKEAMINKDISSILSQVIQLYHNTLKEDPHAQAYLKSRNLLDKELIDTFRIGYSDGSLAKLLPNDESTLTSLKSIGVLNEKGNECFYKSITVPIFNENEQVVGLYGRNIEGKRHLYLKGPHRGVFNHRIFKATDEIILTESIIDALSLYKEGFKNVTSSYGTSGFTEEHLKLLKENSIKSVYIAYDNDSSGQSHAQKIARELTKEGITCKRIHLPEGIKDINDYFRYSKELDFKGSHDTFRVLLKDAKRIGWTLSSIPKKDGLTSYEAHLASFRYSDISYDIKGFDVKDTSELRVIILAKNNTLRHQDRFDLYSAKSRSIFASQVSKRLDINKDTVEKDLLKIIEELENIKSEELNRDDDTKEHYRMTDDEEKEALEFLKDPHLIERIKDDIEACGFVGDEVNKIIAYLIATSRKLLKPLSAIIISQSSSGKSHLMEVIASLMPDEEIEFYSRITPQSLYYMGKDDLRHKLLIVDERSGSEEADYAVRTLQTRHKLTLAYPVKDPNTGRMKTVSCEMMGPISFMESSTKESINPENTSRSFQLYLDESEEQTKRIHEYQKLLRSLDGWKLIDKRSSIIRIHKNAQRLLRPIKIINPFIDKIRFPTQWMRARRDQDRFLSLIEAVTFLYQYQRPIKTDSRDKIYIESTIKDYCVAYNLASTALLDTFSDLSGSLKGFYSSLEQTIKEKSNEIDNFTFRRRDVRKWLNLPDHYVKRQMALLEDLEYVSCERSYRGGTFKYKLMPRFNKDTYLANLTSPNELRKSGTK
jgi:DNA primase catalytic core